MCLKFDITALGESLIDFVQINPQNGNLNFNGNAGGAPANLLATASKFGMSCVFIGKVGNDVFGHYIKRIYNSAGIIDDHIIFCDDAHTTLTFVSLDDVGDRDFFFYRNETADCLISKQDVDVDVIRNTKIFHFGTLSMTNPIAEEATLFAANIAKQNEGTIVSFDPNYRPSLWSSEDAARNAFVCGSRLADIIKISDSELFLLSEKSKPTEAAADILDRYGCSLVVVTLGKDGAFCISKNGRFACADSYDVDTIDTTGAGDASFGAFLSGIIKLGKKISDLSESELEMLINMATACGSLSTAKLGAIPSIPSEAEVMSLVNHKLGSSTLFCS